MNKVILIEVFEKLSKIEKVNILTKEEKKNYGYNDYFPIWKINTEILANDKLVEICLLILFTNEFPLVFPKVFLCPKSYEIINNLPHIDSRKFVCTFDTVITKPNPTEPFGVVYESIKKAKKIIVEGIEKNNYSDFKEEFISYWEDKYNKEKEFPISILLLFDKEEQPKKIKLLQLNSKVGLFKYVLHNGNAQSINFIQYLTDFDIKYSEHNVFYLGDIDFKNTPPFNLKNSDSIGLIDKNLLKDFKKYINNSEYPKIVLLQKDLNGEVFYFGWFYQNIKTDLNGFRKGKLKAFDWISKLAKSYLVKRFSTEKYTYNRLMNRSGGYIETKKYSFSIVGVGSIGSNLYPFLNSMNFPEFRFVDNDNLKLENIARHFLGFNYLGLNKAKALSLYIKQSNPIQSTLYKNESIINVISDAPDFINKSDFLFVTIGDSNIESWLGEKIKAKEINIPTFFIWVEPYLAGGHCLYINPNDNIHYSSFFEGDFFKYNVISKESYIENLDLLSLKEAGCQTTYTPYSASNINSFIVSLYLKIAKIIDSNIQKTTSFTWIGDINNIENLGIKITNDKLKEKIGEIIIN